MVWSNRFCWFVYFPFFYFFVPVIVMLCRVDRAARWSRVLFFLFLFYHCDLCSTTAAGLSVTAHQGKLCVCVFVFSEVIAATLLDRNPSLVGAGV